MIEIEAKKLFKIIAILLIIVDMIIIINVPILSPYIFLFFVLIPGMLIMHILEMEELPILKLYVLSFGISISFIIVTGLIVDNILPIFGILHPLTKYSLTISFNIILFALIFIAYNKNRQKIFHFNYSNFQRIDIYFLLVITILPFLTLFGVELMNYNNNNMILFLMPFLIVIYLILIIYLYKNVSKVIYPISILMIGLSLVLVVPLRTKFIILGGDGDLEFYFFNMTSINYYWAVIHDPVNSSLGGGLLHTIFYSLLGIEKVSIFKLIYPIIFSITPVTLFILFDRYIEPLYSFLASIFFMVQYSYIYVGIGSVRMAMSLFFLAFTMMILFENNINPFNKRALFLLFGSSIILTYYSFSYMFIILIFVTWVLLIISDKIKIYKLENMILTNKSILFILVMIYLWYGQITDSHFTVLIKFFENSISSMADFSSMSSRGELAEKVAGTNLNGMAESINLGIYYVTILIIFIGSINVIVKNKKYKFELEYIIMMVICLAFWLLTMGIPYLSSSSIGILRVYFFTTIILSPMLIFGADTINHLLHKTMQIILDIKRFFFTGKISRANKYFAANAQKNSIIVLLIIGLQLLVNIGIIYQVFGDHRSIILNSKGLQYDIWDISKQEVIGSKWLSNHKNNTFMLFGDFYIGLHLVPFREDDKMKIEPQFFKINHSVKNGYIFLRRQNVLSGMIVPFLVAKSNSEYIPIKNYDNLFTDKGKIYTNGDTEIYG